MRQVEFIQNACERAGIRFEILKTNLYNDYIKNFGKNRTVSVPFWTLDEDGNKGRMRRNCTLDYKVSVIQNYVRWQILGYKKGERTRSEDIKAHEMHLGFSLEEKRRCKENPHKMFRNCFPLVEMGMERKDNYAYIRDVWGLETKASACIFCPFHRNYFFKFLKTYHRGEYQKLIQFDELLEREQPHTKIKNRLYISRSRKRIRELRDEECEDKECFLYSGKEIWTGF